MIWEACNGSQHICLLKGSLLRLVESQERIATTGYVDTLAEQALLEEMLEDSKPSYREDGKAYHYLLKTPFRYPPLTWGSRFGRRHEPSLFYGGADVEVVLAESAYYRFVFWASMDAQPVKCKILTEHTLFSVNYKSSKGVRLYAAPFDEYLADLTNLNNYLPCQLLGSAMRQAGVEAFEYQSARDPLQGVCVGLFTLKAFAEKRPHEMSQWLCELSASEVSFKQVSSRDVRTFPIESFFIHNELPLPSQK